MDFFKKRYIFFGIFCIGFLGSFLFFFYQNPQALEISGENVLREGEEKENVGEKGEKDISSEEKLQEKQDMEFVSPLDNPRERIHKKHFGLYVDPKNSPVFPERFSGYHTGVDFEIFPGEENENVEVRALCSGEIFSLKTVNGYGGVIFQKCLYKEQSIMILYGHIERKSIRFFVGDKVEVGSVLGFLGEGGTEETDGERKHLHLGIVKGNKENVLGYVSSEELLDQWIDPCELFCSL